MAVTQRSSARYRHRPFRCCSSPKTKSDHQQEIRRKYGLRDFADAEAELAEWVAARAWTSGDGPKAIFLDAMTWLRVRKVLLPGVTTLARLVARVREDTTHRLWRVLETLLTPGQRRVLDRLLEVSPGLRVSDLERWRKGPPPRGSGRAIIQALDQVAEIQGLGLAGLGAEAVVPPRRLGELARYGMTADAWLIRRHPDDRRLATLLATTRYLEAKSVDDALELLDLQPEAQVVPGGEHEPQLRRCTHNQQLELAQRLRAQLVHVIDHQPEPVVERAEILQQPLDNRPAVQIRCRRQLPHQRRPGRGVPQRVGHRDPEPLRIVLLALDRPQVARSARPASPIQDRSKNVFPLPGGADTWVRRAARPSRSNNSRRKTTPPLIAGAEPPTVPDGKAGSMALTVSSPRRNGLVRGTRTSRT